MWEERLDGVYSFYLGSDDTTGYVRGGVGVGALYDGGTLVSVCLFFLDAASES